MFLHTWCFFHGTGPPLAHHQELQLQLDALDNGNQDSVVSVPAPDLPEAGLSSFD